MLDKWLSSYKHWANFILRSFVGVIFMAHGAQKLFGAFGGPGLEGAARFFEQLGFVPGEAWAFTVAKYLIKPAQAPLHRTRTSKLDPFKPAIDEWLNRILRLPLRSSFNGYAIRVSLEATRLVSSDWREANSADDF